MVSERKFGFFNEVADEEIRHRLNDKLHRLADEYIKESEERARIAYHNIQRIRERGYRSADSLDSV